MPCLSSSKSAVLRQQLKRCQDELQRCQEELGRCQAESERATSALRAELTMCQEALRSCQDELKQLRNREPGVSMAEHSLPPPGAAQPAAAAQPAPAQPPQPLTQLPAITDFLPAFDPTVSPGEMKLGDLKTLAEEHSMIVFIYQFSELPPGRSLQQHVQELVQGGACPGPFMQDSLVYATDLALKLLFHQNLEQAKVQLAAWYGGAAGSSTGEESKRYTTTPLHSVNEWQSCVKSLLCGQYCQITTNTPILGIPGKRKTQIMIVSYLPLVLVDDDGRRHWGMVRQAWRCPAHLHQHWALRHNAFSVLSSVCFTVVARSNHGIIFQNRLSTALFGSHGRLNRDTGLTPESEPRAEQGSASCPEAASAGAGGTYTSPQSDLRFLDMLFDGCKEDLEKLPDTVCKGVFRQRMEVLHPTLRCLMGLKEGDVAVHDVQIIATHDPVTLEGVYNIIQIDVTGEVLAERALQKTLGLLEEEQRSSHLLLTRQYKLIECLGKIGSMADARVNSDASAQLIEGVLKQIAQQVNHTEGDDIQILKLLGEGAFGKVYQGIWQGTMVAVKVMILPANMSGSETRETLAVMEAGISSSLSHPNLVQTYTYTVQPLSGLNGLEMRLVQEYCDGGSLRHALVSGAFNNKTARLNYRAVLETAADIARGTMHLHALNILHLDLKAHNVLLKSSVNESRCITAKIADFGLSLKMDNADTHISQVWQGTPTHTAPEVFLSGTQSKAADVYAFGILLYELYTAELPFREVPSALLAHGVSQENLRPVFPVDAPAGYVALAQRCWDASAKARPTFEEILQSISELRIREGGTTERVQILTDLDARNMGRDTRNDTC